MFVREACENKEIDIEYVNTSEDIADILTKPVSRDQFEKLVRKWE